MHCRCITVDTSIASIEILSELREKHLSVVGVTKVVANFFLSRSSKANKRKVAWITAQVFFCGAKIGEGRPSQVLDNFGTYGPDEVALIHCMSGRNLSSGYIPELFETAIQLCDRHSFSLDPPSSFCVVSEGAEYHLQHKSGSTFKTQSRFPALGATHLDQKAVSAGW